MKKFQLCFRAMQAGLFLANGAAPVFAADKAADQSKRLQQQLRAAEREKSQLTAKKAELETQLKEAQDALTGAKRRGDSASRRSSELKRDLEAMTADKEALQAKLTDTEQALAAEQRKHAETEARRLETLRWGEELTRMFLAERQRAESALAASRERNERMYKLGNEMIDRYERAAVSQAEPITGLRRAQIEKMAEEERDRYDKERLPPAPVSAAPALPAAPAAAPAAGSDPAGGVMYRGGAR
jgi:chromosome segregation ATPase